MIGDPDTRYREDPVRMLRAVRFAAKLDFHIDRGHARADRHAGRLLANVPAARMFDEMLKLLMSGHALACVTGCAPKACTTACCRCSTPSSSSPSASVS